MFDKHGDKANAAINEYVKKNGSNLGLVMQYLIGPWNADYSILPEKTLQNPMVKILKQRNDAWAKEREESLKRQEEARANTAPGKKFADLDLVNMTNTNNRPSLSDIVGKGRHVLVHFSYSDDGAIKDSVEALWKKQKGGKVDVIGIKCTHISSSDFHDKIYKDMGISYKMYYDTSHKSSQYGLGGKDEVILFGPDGTILWRDIAAEELEKAVKDALNGQANVQQGSTTGYSSQDDKYKAMFIYNFTKSVEWPANVMKGDFVICVVNQDNMLKQMEAIANGKMVGDCPISVIGVKNINEIPKCHILYLPSNVTNADISAAVAKVGDAATLIVSDRPGTVKYGSCINLVLVDDKIRFEINDKAIKDRNLQLNKTLLAGAVNS